MKSAHPLRKWLWWFTLIAASILVYKTGDTIGSIFSGIGGFIAIFTPFIVGFAIAFLLYAPCRRLELLLSGARPRFVRQYARMLSMLICYLLFLAAIAGFLVLLLPSLYSAVSGFVSSLPQYYEALSAKLADMASDGGLFDRLHLTESLKTVYDSAYGMLLSLANTESILTVVRNAMSVVSNLINVLMAFIISAYMLAQREALLRSLKSLLGAFMSQSLLDTLTGYAHKTAAIFYNYLYGAVVDMAVVAVIMAIGLSLFRLPRAVLLGCFIGIMNLIPYFGAIISGALVILLALLTKNIYTAIGIAVYIVVMQQVDANIIQPRIIGQTVGVRPIYVLLAITVGGGLFGFWGILLSVPSMAVLIMLLKEWIAYRQRKKRAPGADAPQKE